MIMAVQAQCIWVATMTSPQIGCSKDDLDTPALCIDLDVLDANIAAMAGYCRQHGVDWRPHAKCHKNSTIAKMVVDAGAIGVTCAKVGEAEVMAAGGVTDLLIANQIVGAKKLERLIKLRQIADPIACVDSVEQAEPLAQAMSGAGLEIRVIIEVNIGMDRAGTTLGQPTVDLAQKLAEMPGLRFSGVMGYEGHLLTIEDPEEKVAKIHAALDELLKTKELVEQAGIACPIVSCGGTGSYRISATHKGITELQAGGAIFMDLFYRNCCQLPELGYAMKVLTTVVSRPAPNRAIIDAGRKTLNQEQHKPGVADRPDISVQNLSAEHGTLLLEPGADRLSIGDRLELIPGYVDFTTVFHNEFFCFRNGRLETILPIEARGKVQ